MAVMNYMAETSPRRLGGRSRETLGLETFKTQDRDVNVTRRDETEAF